MASPSVIIRERDNTIFTPADTGVGVALIGYASKGPFNQVTLVRSPTEFDDVFGKQTESALGYYAMRKMFEATNRVYFVRAGTPSAANKAVLNLDFTNSTTVDPFAAETNATLKIDFLRDRSSGTGFSTSNFEFHDGVALESVDIDLTLDPTMTGTQIVNGYESAFNALSTTLKRGFTVGTKVLPVAQVLTTTFTDAVDVDGGTLDIVLAGGAAITITLSGSETASDIGDEVRSEAAAFAAQGWTVGGTGATVTFTSAPGSAFIRTGTNTITDNGTGITVPSITVATSGVNGSLTFTSSKDGPGETVTLLTVAAPSDFTSTITAGTEESFPGQAIEFIAKEEGEYYKNLTITRESVLNQFNGTTSYNIYVSVSGVIKESFKNVSFDSTNERYFITLINRSVNNGGSKLVNINTTNTTIGSGSVWAWAKTGDLTVNYTFSATTNSAVNNGIPSSETDKAIAFLNAIQTSGLENIEASDFHIVVAPEASDLEAVKDELITLCETRGECVTIVDTPSALASTYPVSPTEVRDYHNGVGGWNNRTASFNTSYAALYSTWGVDFNQFSGKTEEVPPSIFMTNLILRNVLQFGYHLASAGDTRGRLNLAGLVYSPSKAERDQIYDGLNAVNPIVDFASKGITVYGQKTLYRENSALNRLNNRMLINDIKKKIKVRMDSLLFDPTSPDSWKKAERSVIAILEPLRASGALETYSIIFDATINTPEVVRENKIKGIISVTPYNTIETVEIDLNIEQSGTDLTER